MISIEPRKQSDRGITGPGNPTKGDELRMQRLSIVLAILLVVSIVANINLMISRLHTAGKPAELTSAYAKDSLGYLNGLEEELDSAREKNWSDANQLWAIYSHIESAGLRSSSILDLITLVDRDLATDIPQSGLNDLFFDLRHAGIAFSNAAANRANNLEVDTQRLEEFRLKVKRASFPTQSSFTWQELQKSIDRYLDKKAHL